MFGDMHLVCLCYIYCHNYNNLLITDYIIKNLVEKHGKVAISMCYYKLQLMSFTFIRTCFIKLKLRNHPVHQHDTLNIMYQMIPVINGNHCLRLLIRYLIAMFSAQTISFVVRTVGRINFKDKKF